MITPYPQTDRLIANLHIKLTEDQQLYLNAHKKEKRTILAKKLGISKLRLNHILHSMAPNIDEVKRRISKKMRANQNARKTG